jgi:hypothetical protein
VLFVLVLLGLEAQQAAAQRHLATFGGSLVAEYTKVETGNRSVGLSQATNSTPESIIAAM